MAQDFTGLSELLLGQAQPKQFQSYDDEQPLGWWWGSKVSDDGTFTPLVDPDANGMSYNANTVMPRSYYSGNQFGTYYNFYASTAESGTYSSASTVSDSICPSGWRIPLLTNDVNMDKSWRKLLVPAYADDYGQELATAIRKYPVSLLSSGGYLSLVDGNFQNPNTRSYVASSSGKGSGTAGRLAIETNGINVGTAVQKPTGITVRCVKRD